MFYQYEDSITFKIHAYFPQNVLIETFECLLNNYLFSQYSLNYSLKNKNTTILKLKLKMFSSLNPKFGKKKSPCKRNRANTSYNDTEFYTYVNPDSFNTINSIIL